MPLCIHLKSSTMARNVTQKLMESHMVSGRMQPGEEIGATSTVFPSDEAVRRFLKIQQRGDAWCEIQADPGAAYDEIDTIDLDRRIKHQTQH